MATDRIIETYKIPRERFIDLVMSKEMFQEQWPGSVNGVPVKRAYNEDKTYLYLIYRDRNGEETFIQFELLPFKCPTVQKFIEIFKGQEPMERNEDGHFVFIARLAADEKAKI